MNSRLAYLALLSAPAACAEIFTADLLARMRDVMSEIYNLDYEAAATRSRALIATAPGDPAGYVLLARTYWAELLSREQALSIDRFAASDFFSESPRYRVQPSPEAEARFRKSSDDAVQKARERLAKNPGDAGAQYLLGLAYQNMASFEASLKRNWWAAARLGNRTFRYHHELLRVEPGFADPRLTTGVYNYIAGSLSWRVKWLAYLLGFQGSLERGKSDLELAASKGQLVADDARTILVLIYTREKQYQRAFDKLAELLAKFPQNYLAELEMAGLAMRMNRPADAVSIYNGILGKIDRRQHRYERLESAVVYNRLGVALRGRGELKMSEDWFRRALARPGVSSRSTAIAHLELGKTLDLADRREEALEHYRAAQAGEDTAGSRQEAALLIARRFQSPGR